jgi:acyl-CoA thioesterase FadM
MIDLPVVKAGVQYGTAVFLVQEPGMASRVDAVRTALIRLEHAIAQIPADAVGVVEIGMVWVPKPNEPRKCERCGVGTINVV